MSLRFARENGYESDANFRAGRRMLTLLAEGKRNAFMAGHRVIKQA